MMLGIAHHVLFQLCGDLFRHLFDFGDTLVVCDDFRLDGVCLLRFFLLHEFADLRAQRIALRAERIPFFLQLAPFRIEFEDFVHERELFILKFLSDIFAHRVGVCAQKIDVDHPFVSLRFSLHLLFYPIFALFAIKCGAARNFFCFFCVFFYGIFFISEQNGFCRKAAPKNCGKTFVNGRAL